MRTSRALAAAVAALMPLGASAQTPAQPPAQPSATAATAGISGVITEPFGVLRHTFDADFRVQPRMGSAGIGDSRIQEERSTLPRATATASRCSDRRPRPRRWP